MPQTKNEIEEICSLVEIPRLFISNHFIDLKSEIDLFFVQLNQTEKTEKNNKLWLDIIEKVNKIEIECLVNPNLQCFGAEIKEEIVKLESNRVKLSDSRITQLKFKIESFLLQNQTITFMNKRLLIVTDAYLNKNNIKTLEKTRYIKSEKIKKIIILILIFFLYFE